MNFDVQMPSEEEIDFISKIFSTWEWLTQPQFIGLENIPKNGPLLFVSNHTIIGGLDVPIIWLKLVRDEKIFLRMLVDHAHFQIPMLKEFLIKYGEVEGTRKNADFLLESKQHVLVFPGGAREAFKKKGEAYQLLWRENLGFAKLAIAHGCPIVTLASVGPEECYDIVWDADDYLKSPLGKIIQKYKFRKDLLVPFVKGFGPTLLPKPQKFYFKFGSPIESTDFNKVDSNENAQILKSIVKNQLESDIQYLIDFRKNDIKKSSWQSNFSKWWKQG